MLAVPFTQRRPPDFHPTAVSILGTGGRYALYTARPDDAMSVQHISWAMEQMTGSPSRKAVLVALADYANATSGKCCPHIATIAKRTELSEATVKRALVELVTAGFFTRGRDRRPDGTLGGYHYVLPAVLVIQVSRESEPGSTMHSDPGSTVTPQEPGTSLEPNPPVSPPTAESVALRKRTLMVDRKQATDEEMTLAALILGMWNSRTKQNLRAGEWLAKIIMRCREHPDASLDDHVRVIDHALANPWWTGAASPSVIYGSAAQFERSVVAMTAPQFEKQPPLRYGRGMTTKQILEATKGQT